MPRFFYDIDDRGRRVVDYLGIDQDDLTHAMCDAVFLAKILATECRFSTCHGPIRVRVREAKTGLTHEITVNSDRS